MEFARHALEKSLGDPQALLRAVGESLSEPKAHVFFEPKASDLRGGLVLDRRSRMLYDERHIFINGESYRASGKDFGLLKELADSRSLSHRQAMGLSAQARGLLQEWLEMGWMHATEAD